MLLYRTTWHGAARDGAFSLAADRDARNQSGLFINLLVLYVPHIYIKYSIPDAVPPIHAVSYHVATDKGPSKFRSTFSDNLQPIATRGKKARDTLLVDIGCSSKRAPLSVSYYNEISGGHIGSCRCSEEGLCRPSTAPVVRTTAELRC